MDTPQEPLSTPQTPLGQPTQPSVPPSSIPHKKKTLIFIIIACLIITGGLYLLNTRIAVNEPAQTSPSPTLVQKSPTSTPDPTANWKTYTDSVYGFEIKFPSEWAYVQTTQGSINNKIEPFDFFTASNSNITNFAITSSDNELDIEVDIKTKDVKSLAEEKKSFLNLLQKNELGIKSVEDTSIASKEAIEIMAENHIKSVGKEYNFQVKSFIVLNDKNYKFIIKIPNKTGSDKILFNQILSTFKFLDQNQTVNTNSALGTITGKLCYPSSLLPKGQIIAKSLTTGETFSQDYPGSMNGGGLTYTMQLKPDTYYLKYQVSPTLIGFYDDYSSCVDNVNAANDPNCTGQQTRPVLPVKIISGNITQNINLCDFYYPPNNPPQF